jgi:hypothetical protein
MLESSAFAVAERVSRLRQGGRPMFSRAQVAAALARAREDNDLLGPETRSGPNGSGPERATDRELDLDVDDPELASGAA